MGDSLISQMSSGWSLELAVPLISGCVGIVLLIRSRRHLLGTTLVAPASWALISWITVTLLQTITTGWELRSPATWNYLAAATTLCPTMAVLGAKRPQDRGWQFIVASLWIVLALPAAQDLAFAPGGGFELHPAWAWFLALLIALGLLNYLPTRFAFSAVLIALAQIILLEAQLPDLGMKLSGYHPFAIPLLTIGLVIACWRTRSGIHRQGWNGAWLDFRDAFGSVWALWTLKTSNRATSLPFHGIFSCAGFDRVVVTALRQSLESVAVMPQLPLSHLLAFHQGGIVRRHRPDPGEEAGWTYRQYSSPCLDP